MKWYIMPHNPDVTGVGVCVMHFPPLKKKKKYATDERSVVNDTHVVVCALSG